MCKVVDWDVRYGECVLEKVQEKENEVCKEGWNVWCVVCVVDLFSCFDIIKEWQKNGFELCIIVKSICGGVD